MDKKKLEFDDDSAQVLGGVLDQALTTLRAADLNHRDKERRFVMAIVAFDSKDGPMSLCGHDMPSQIRNGEELSALIGVLGVIMRRINTYAQRLGQQDPRIAEIWRESLEHYLSEDSGISGTFPRGART